MNRSLFITTIADQAESTGAFSERKCWKYLISLVPKGGF